MCKIRIDHEYYIDMIRFAEMAIQLNICKGILSLITTNINNELIAIISRKKHLVNNNKYTIELLYCSYWA